MRNRKNLGFAETIYEEEDDCEFSSASPSLSPAISSPSTPLHTRVESWTRATGHSTEVLIRVQGKCFQLHKDPLISRSTYLKRQLTAFVSDFTLPLNISPETFILVADFCYGARLVITLFNVAALRTAAELLEMTETNDYDDNNLLQLIDSYFSQVIAVNRDYVSVVFRSCMPLLPEAETVAFLVSRCIEALALSGDGDNRVDWLHEVITVCPEDFQIVAEVIQRRFGSHDVVYKLVSLYSEIQWQNYRGAESTDMQFHRLQQALTTRPSRSSTIPNNAAAFRGPSHVDPAAQHSPHHSQQQLLQLLIIITILSNSYCSYCSYRSLH